MHKSHNHKYEPKKDKLNINYDEYKKIQEKENKKDFENTHDFKFMFYYIPEEITKNIMGIRLSLLIKLVSIFYAYRALKSLREEIAYNTIQKKGINVLNFIFNSICIFTSILLYFSMYKKSFNFMRFSYYVYLFHFFYKLIETILYLYNKLSHKRYHINAIIGIILGLSTSSVLNLISTWIIFSYMVYIYNINYGKTNAHNL